MIPWTSPRTRALIALLAALLAIRGWQTLAVADPPALPRAPAVDAQAVTRVVLERVGGSIAFVRRADGWSLAAPVEADADRDDVEALVRTFGRGVPMRAAVGSGGGRTFGLGNDSVVTVQLFGSAGTPLVAVSVGASAGGDEAFVQLPGDPTVYRADVGGRAWLERAPRAWRDRAVLRVAPEAVTRIELVRPSGAALLERAAEGGWTVRDPAPPGSGRRGASPSATPPPADPETVSQLLALLTGLEALSVEPVDPDVDREPPAVEVRLALRDGTAHRLVVGRADGGGASVRVDARPELLRVPPRVVELLALGVEELSDRRLLPVDPADVREVSLDEDGYVFAASRGADGRWSVARPVNLAADGAALDEGVATLVSLRAEGRVDVRAPRPGASTLRVRLRDGRTETFTFGAVVRDAQGRPLLEVGTARGGVRVDASQVARLRRALGRG
jgi:hypothetical protein